MENIILGLIAQQKKSREIADLLYLSEKTIRNHRYNIKKKLDLPNENNSLLRWAVTSFKCAWEFPLVQKHNRITSLRSVILFTLSAKA